MAIGQWLKTYGESLYGTRSGPVQPAAWGATTRKGNIVFLHVLEHEGGIIEIPGFQPKLRSALFFDDRTEVEVKKSGDGIAIMIPTGKLKPVDTIIRLELR